MQIRPLEDLTKDELIALIQQERQQYEAVGAGGVSLIGDAKDAEIDRLKGLIKDFGKIIHDMVAAQQAAWIVWKHGDGAEAAMIWIHNGLVGPGHIPDEDAPYGKEAQAWYDANCADPLPTCYCGRPSNITWMSEGFCCNEHYQQRRAVLTQQEQA